MLKKEIDRIRLSHTLDISFLKTVKQYYQPLATRLANYSRRTRGCKIIGMQGCQGSGKSTLADFLRILLQLKYGLKVAVLSLDDFYLNPEERKSLAENVHPLMVTRGVPGTHDITLALETIDKLKKLNTHNSLALPRFDKATDKRATPENWPTVSGPVDLILLEGWCIGATAQTQVELSPALNKLESEEDHKGQWRQYVNTCLKQEYQTLFMLIDRLLVIQAPNFSCVYQWRALQEQKLAEEKSTENSENKKNNCTR